MGPCAWCMRHLGRHRVRPLWDEGLGGNGVFYGGNQLGVQLFGLAMIILWVGTFSCMIFAPMRMAGLLRLSDDFQDAGADLMEHSPSKAYAAQISDGASKEVA